MISVGKSGTTSSMLEHDYQLSFAMIMTLNEAHFFISTIQNQVYLISDSLDHEATINFLSNNKK